MGITNSVIATLLYWGCTCGEGSLNIFNTLFPFFWIFPDHNSNKGKAIGLLHRSHDLPLSTTSQISIFALSLVPGTAQKGHNQLIQTRVSWDAHFVTHKHVVTNVPFLTWISVMDVSNFDFVRRYVGGREGLSLHAIEQARLSRVPIAADYHFHCVRILLVST